MNASDQLPVVLAGGYSFDRLEELIEDLQPVLRLEQPVTLAVDLRGLEFVGPTCLALLVAALKRVRDKGLNAPGSVIRQPASPDVRQYLARMDFMKLLVAEPPNEDFERKQPVGFRSCQHFRTEEEQWATSRTLVEALVESCDCDEKARGALAICLDEVCENVLHHAHTPLGGFAAAQGWRARGDFEIGIVDLGVGVRSSLARNARYADLRDDATAIETALVPRVTSTPERNAGIGLAVTRLLLAANGGSFTVRSGFGAVRDVAGETSVEEASAELPGTVVSLRASSERALDIGAVYAKLEALEAAASHQGSRANADT